MANRRRTGLYARAPREQVVDGLVERTRQRWAEMDAETLRHLLEDALFHERARVERCKADEPERVRDSTCLPLRWWRGLGSLV